MSKQFYLINEMNLGLPKQQKNCIYTAKLHAGDFNLQKEMQYNAPSVFYCLSTVLYASLPLATPNPQPPRLCILAV